MGKPYMTHSDDEDTSRWGTDGDKSSECSCNEAEEIGET
jgi:hypothetical protein